MMRIAEQQQCDECGGPDHERDANRHDADLLFDDVGVFRFVLHYFDDGNEEEEQSAGNFEIWNQPGFSIIRFIDFVDAKA